MDILRQIAGIGIVPVVVIENAEDAVPTAKALAAGGINIMEITFRTNDAADAIRSVSEKCPDVIVGAGTVLNAEQAELAVRCGAQFVVAPGYDEETVTWCLNNGTTVIPGCVTPTEIMLAVKHGLHVLKFFPAGVYGGVKAMRALSGPFPGISFIPTGGVDQGNIKEYASFHFVQAVGGSWICTKADISAHRFDKITHLCIEARKELLGFEVAHVGINSPDKDTSFALVNSFASAFGFDVKAGNSSNFAGAGIEVTKSPYLGSKGHIAIRTNKMLTAIAELESRGFSVDYSTAKEKNGVINAVYLKDEFGGFAVHLLQK